jgi:hypothetical protein
MGVRSLNLGVEKGGTAPDYLPPARGPEKSVQLPIFPSGKKGVAPVFPLGDSIGLGVRSLNLGVS